MTQLQFKTAFNPELSAWVYWPGGEFKVRVKYLSMTGAEKLVKDCQIVEFDPRTHLRTERIDDEKFKKKIADLVLDWSDLTAAKAKKFVNLAEGTPDEGEFPCTPDHKLFVVANFVGFPTFILDTAKALHTMKEDQDQKEEKNS
jgi:hypothetical protein